MNRTKIDWCDYTWDPVTGCLHGCSYCYGRRIAERFKGSKAYPFGFEPTSHLSKRCNEPMLVKQSSKILVCSMADLFGDWNWKVPWNGGIVSTDAIINSVLEIVRKCPQHTFLFLTKNPKRYGEFEFPPNAWVGITVEDQASANERIPLLLQANAVVKFVSLEPMLGPVDLGRVSFRGDTLYYGGNLFYHGLADFGRISWYIAGGETGPGARPLHPDWVRSLRDQGHAARVPFFFKGWGSWAPTEPPAKNLQHPNHKGLWAFADGGYCRLFDKPCDDAVWMEPIGKKRAGRLLDGREWNQFPK